jgi:hypothetical protein
MTTFPMIHLNGTSRDALLEGYIDCVNAVRHAIEVVQKNAPNGRDYYYGTVSTREINKALAEHEARLEKLEAVLAELREIGEHVAGLD